MNGIAIIVAAGKGERAGVDKVWVKLGGKPIFLRATEPFFNAPLIEEVIVVVREERVAEARALFTDAPLPCIVIAGGSDRTESVRLALEEAKKLAADSPDCLVAIHDGARPYVTGSLIRKAMIIAREAGSAVPIVPVVDSLRTVYEDETSSTLDRTHVGRVQTPQCFRLREILAAYKSGEKATDDATLYERIYGSPTLFGGDVENEKITYLSDIYRDTASRVGVGYDAHRLEEGRSLVLGGVRIEHDKGLVGHSDADALTHAVMDALLTAAGLPDIGHYFPPSDPKYKDAYSIKLLKKVAALIKEKGFAPVNVSATVMAEKPKLAPYLSEMESTIAKTLEIAHGAVKIAATTTEGLGIVGEEKGIAAHAVAMLRSFD
ncbi:MAG: 2-C-methyl-D-erythritol 2,4-cyclodiphosphate synthase [Clostridia bacterium]|nr:2-C-methyl-D-erythritol 2,4-cyclodiphosphate synthase [Clostridia bacterium]